LVSVTSFAEDELVSVKCDLKTASFGH